MTKQLHDNICEEQIFSSIFNKHSKDLHNFLYYKFGDLLNPKDKVQEAFIKFWNNCKKVLPGKAKSFLYTIANNLFLNEYSKSKVVMNFKNSQTKNYTNESPEFLLEEKEFDVKLQRAISNLTVAQRTAFLMNRIDGKKYKEIAEFLNISVKAVEKRIHNALLSLRKEIENL